AVLLHVVSLLFSVFFFSSRRRHTRCLSDWSSDVCSSDLRDKRSLALTADDKIVGGERVERLAHGALRNAEPRRKLELARDRLARSPLDGGETLDEELLDLQVQRAVERPRGDTR